MKKLLFGIISYAILIGLSIGMYHYCVDLYTHFNAFPIEYHPDENTKASQILNDERNYNHPLLMLEAADYVIKRDNVSRDMWDVVLAGRKTSACLAALAAVLMAWGGWFAGRWIGFFAVAFGAGLCPTLLAHAHYFKEEPSLCLGIACVICVGGALSKQYHWIIMLALSLLMGGAVGVAASGKYAGIIMFGPAILMILLSTARKWVIMPFCLVLCVVGFYQTWTWINERAVKEWPTFWANFLQEKNHAFTEHSGVSMNKPNGFFIDAAWTDAMPHIKVLAIAGIIALIGLTIMGIVRLLSKKDPSLKKPYRPSLVFGWWLIITLVIVATGISFSAIPFFRYCVPIVFLLNVLAAISISWIYHILPRPTWLRLSFLATAMITLACTQWLRCQDFTYQYAHDSRDELPKWIAENLKNNPRILTDGYTQLNSGDIAQYGSQASVIRDRFAASVGSIESVRQQFGIQYIITANTSRDRWISPYSIKAEGDPEGFDGNKKFYLDLINHYPVVHEWKAYYPMNTFTNPDIVIYRIDQGRIDQGTKK